MDAVIIRLSACWSPVKDKETPVAQLTLSDGLCEKQPSCACAGLHSPLLPPSGTRQSSVAHSQMTSLVKQLKDCTKKCSPLVLCGTLYRCNMLYLKDTNVSTQPCLFPHF